MIEFKQTVWKLQKSSFNEVLWYNI